MVSLYKRYEKCNCNGSVNFSPRGKRLCALLINMEERHYLDS